MLLQFHTETYILIQDVYNKGHANPKNSAKPRFYMGRKSVFYRHLLFWVVVMLHGIITVTYILATKGKTALCACLDALQHIYTHLSYIYVYIYTLMLMNYTLNIHL